MKKIKLMVLAAVAAAACSGNPEEAASFDVIDLQDRYEFAADLGQSETFKISSNRKWSITTENLDWVDIDPIKSLGGHQTITIFPDNNTLVFDRTGTFTLKSDGYEKTVTISQRGQGAGLDVFAPDTLKFDYLGITADPVFKIATNANWSASASEEWIALSPTCGTYGETPVTVSAAINKSTEPRKGSVTVTADDLTRKFIVTQSGKPAPYISLSEESLRFNKLGRPDTSSKISVSANCNWVATPSVSWLQVSPASGELGITEVTISMSETTEERSGVITFSCAEEGLSVTLDILQKAETVDLNKYVDFTVGSKFLWGSTSSTYVESADWANFGRKTANDSPVYNDKALVWVEWIRAANGASYTPVFSISSKCMRVTYVYTGDGLLFHLPVRHIEAGRTLQLDLGFNLTGKKPKYWLAQYSLDGGDSWLYGNTGNTYTTPGLGVFANICIETKSVLQSVVISCPVTETVEYQEIQIKVFTPDGTIDINGTDPSELPASSGTATFGVPTGCSGPTITLK